MNQLFNKIKPVSLTVGKKLYASFMIILILMCILGLTTMSQLFNKLPGIPLPQPKVGGGWIGRS